MSRAPAPSYASRGTSSLTPVNGGSAQGSDYDSDGRVNLLLTFGLVPLIAVGVTWLYDSYVARNSIKEVEKKSTAADGAKEKMSTGSFEDMMRPTPSKGADDGKRRSSSSFFVDEEEKGDHKGRESRVFEGVFDEMTVGGSNNRRHSTRPDDTDDGEDIGGHFRLLGNPGSPSGISQHTDQQDNVNKDNSGGAGPWSTLGLEQPLVVAMVGLPARGKSYLVMMIIRYLSWSGFECRLFNVGSHRRRIGLSGADSSFYDDKNDQGRQMRQEMALAVQNDMYQWLHESTSKRRVAFFDATNTTEERRRALAQRARAESTFLLFIESICDDADTLRRNYELKLYNDDYKGMDPAKAREDFLRRVEMYAKVYETILDTEDEGQLSYIKIINVGQKMITRNCSGYVPSQISFYLQNVHIHPRKIYLSLTSTNRAGGAEEASLYSMQHGESANLTSAGEAYSRSLAEFCERVMNDIAAQKSAKDATGGAANGGCRSGDLLVLSGASRVHAETLLHLRMLFSCYSTTLLNEMRGGDLHGLTRAEIKQRFPQEYESRARNKLRYRFPGVGGESYLDVIERVRPVIIELERQRRSVLVVCHIAVLRCIYAYLTGTKLEDIPYLPFKTHHVYELTPGPFGCTCVVHDLSSDGSRRHLKPSE